jgi:hypothetical protein
MNPLWGLVVVLFIFSIDRHALTGKVQVTNLRQQARIGWGERSEPQQKAASSFRRQPV